MQKLEVIYPNNFVGGTCLGFINGVAEVLLLYRVICYNHVTRGELSDTVVKYMNDHPDEQFKSILPSCLPGSR